SDVDSTAKTTSVTDATTGITLTTPTLVTPTNNQQFRNAEQPLTLTVKNAVSTGKAALTYTFEDATDQAFANRTYSKDSVPEGSGGQTALKTDRIAPATTSFWRVGANSGSIAGPYTNPRSFAIGPEVVLQQPSLVSPANGGTASGSPTLVVNNVGRTGPVGQVVYRFEVASDPGFGSLLLT